MSIFVFLSVLNFILNAQTQDVCFWGRSASTNAFLNGHYSYNGIHNGRPYYTKSLTGSSCSMSSQLYLYFSGSMWAFTDTLGGTTFWARCHSSGDPTITCTNQWLVPTEIDPNVYLSYGSCPEWNCDEIITTLSHPCQGSFTKQGANTWYDNDTAHYWFFAEGFFDWVCAPSITYDPCGSNSFNAMTNLSGTGWIDFPTDHNNVELPFFSPPGTEIIVCLGMHSEAPTSAPTSITVQPTHAPTAVPTSAPSMAPFAAPTRSPSPWCPTLNLTVIDHIVPSLAPTREPTPVRRRNLLASRPPTATPTQLPTPNVTIFDRRLFDGVYVYKEAINHLPVFEAPGMGYDKRIYYNDSIPNGYWIIEGEGTQRLSFGPTGVTFPDSHFNWTNNMISGIFKVSMECLPITWSPTASPVNVKSTAPIQVSVGYRSGPFDDDVSYASCPSNAPVLVSCGLKPDFASDNIAGSYPLNGECVAQNEVFGDGVFAVALCTNNDYTCTYRTGPQSAAEDDAESTVECMGADEIMVSCSPYTHWEGIDGAYVGMRHESTIIDSATLCTAQNGRNGDGVWSKGICCKYNGNDGYRLDCKTEWGPEVSNGMSLASCDYGYVIWACS
eukprot:623127_1